MRIGSLFSGYGGLDMAVEDVFGATTAWVSDIDKGACKILAHRYPDVPNLGDITSVDWASVEPVDIITGGSPCQDLSHAGKRQGMTEGTRSNLWVAMREAIAQLRPRYVIWENVRGAYSAEADSELEFCAGCMGDPGLRGPVLHALGRVLGDLSDLGYDCRWHGLRAADVGACHGRFRVFVVATDATQPERRTSQPEHLGATIRSAAEPRERTPADAADLGHERSGQSRRWGAGPADGGLLPTPRATDGTKGGPNQRGSSGDLMLPSVVASLLPAATTRDHKDHMIRREPHRPDDVDTLSRALTLLPTPNPFHMGNDESPEEWRNRRLDVFKRTGTRHGPALNVVVKSVLEGNPLDPAHYMPDEEGEAWTPSAQPAGTTRRRSASTASSQTQQESLLTLPAASAGPRTTTSGSLRPLPQALDGAATDWGLYAAAIARWEHVLGRPAPAPTMTSTKGNPQLSPIFVEWLMGLPAGWVTAVPGITRNEALKALGNGVVPQQAAAALRTMLAWEMAS